jgi:hypothetical protein
MIQAPGDNVIKLFTSVSYEFSKSVNYDCKKFYNFGPRAFSYRHQVNEIQPWIKNHLFNRFELLVACRRHDTQHSDTQYNDI